MENNQEQSNENEDHLREGQLWKRIWAGKVPNKIRVFAWRLCQEILTVFHNFYRRKIDVQPICPLCQQGVETTIHAIRDCLIACDVWQMQLGKPLFMQSVVPSCPSPTPTVTTPGLIVDVMIRSSHLVTSFLYQ